jgi:F-type H+-transporting ATPase subunit b
MASTTTSTGTTHQANFPPFDTSTFPSQLFWLTISFALLFVVLWKIAGPRLNAVISGRRHAINDDIAKAQAARSDAEKAAAAYDAALRGARGRAQVLADETRKELAAEIAAAKAAAEVQAQEAMALADARIKDTREKARGHVAATAAQAAIAIVAKLTGAHVSLSEAEAAIAGRKQ